MSLHNDLQKMKGWQAAVDGRIRDIEKGTTETRPAPRFLTGEPVGPWQTLGPYLPPHWRGTSNSPFSSDADYSDLRQNLAPRFYLDRDRIYLGGVIEFDVSRAGESWTTPGAGSPGSTILSAIIVGFPHLLSPARDHHFELRESLYFSATGFLPQDIYTYTSGGLTTNRLGLFGQYSTAYPTEPRGFIDGMCCTLDHISWRIDKAHDYDPAGAYGAILI